MCVVAPTPLMINKALLPAFGCSFFISKPIISSAVSLAETNCLRPPPPSPCCPIPISISPSGRSEMVMPFCGWVQDFIATANVAKRALKRSPISIISSSDLPSSAAAPTILIKGTQPARPRRSSSGASSPALISSCVRIVFTLMPVRSANWHAMFALMISPEWFNTTSKIPASRLNICKAWNKRCAPGAAKISPTTEQSNIPSPTKPLNAGS